MYVVVICRIFLGTIEQVNFVLFKHELLASQVWSLLFLRHFMYIYMYANVRKREFF